MIRRIEGEQDQMCSVDLLVAQAKKHHEHILTNQFFHDLSMGLLDDLQWTRYLLYFCDHFTRCLSLRAGLCEDDKFKNMCSDHDAEEAKHRKQLQAWMVKEGISIEGLQPTKETVLCADFCRRVAQFAEPKVQVFILNVLAEGMALTFFTKAVETLKRLNKLHGPYWHVHKEVDELHMQMGLDLIGSLSDSDIVTIKTLLNQGGMYFWDMIGSWRRREARPSLA